MKFFSKKKVPGTVVNSFGKLKDEGFNFDLIERYFIKKTHDVSYQVISDKICNDLDFEELFMFLDRTNSKVGQQFLYNQLRVIRHENLRLDHEENFIQNIINNQSQRVYIQNLISKLNHNDAYHIASLFQETNPKPPRWFWIIPALSVVNLSLLICIFFYPQSILFLIGTVAISVGFHYWNKTNIYQYLVSIPQLLKMHLVASKLFKQQELTLFNPNLQKSLDVLSGLRTRMSFFSLESNLGSEISGLIWSIAEVIKIIFLLEPILLFDVLKRLQSKRTNIEEAFAFIGKIDALISIASLRVGLENYCIPSFVKDDQIEICDGYHPLVLDCTENSIQILKKSVLLTGSNMSGKTTFIRTIAINSITALTINTCFAKSLSIPRFNIHSAIRMSDDLMNDKSYYFEEVLSIKEMIEASYSNKPNLFLLDEIFKGTNTIERIAAGKAVLSKLSQGNNIVFVSTHDVELADLLESEYELYHFSEKVNSREVDFDYKLKNGKLKNRNAIKILEMNGYPQSVVSEALNIAQKLDQGTKT